MNELQKFKALKLKARSATLLMLPEQAVTTNLALGPVRRIEAGPARKAPAGVLDEA